mgnify:CR=1 FL=1
MPLALGIKIAIAAFLAEYVDSTLGMGYGTLLTGPRLSFLYSKRGSL